jgi:hypothetical protein
MKDDCIMPDPRQFQALEFHRIASAFPMLEAAALIGTYRCQGLSRAVTDATIVCAGAVSHAA